MGKFIKKILLMVAITFVGFIILSVFDRYVIGGQYKYNYQASLIDKVNRLEGIDEPKIILIGNSNLAFGISSEIIEDKIGLPVVNLGLHGGLGNAYHEEISKLNINKGDIVVVCHTDFEDDDKIADPSLAWITYDYNDELWPIIRKKDYVDMMTSYPLYLRNSYRLWITRRGNRKPVDVYSRLSFNEYGDVAIKNPEEQVDVDEYFSRQTLKVPGINDICISRLNSFNEYCNQRDATLLIAAYPIAYGKYSEYSKEDFRIFKEKLTTMLDCDVISDYTDYFYPYEYFYNSPFHLNELGTNIRTEQLINDLKKWQNDQI